VAALQSYCNRRVLLLQTIHRRMYNTPNQMLVAVLTRPSQHHAATVTDRLEVTVGPLPADPRDDSL
jgi:hypothetical protein